MQGPNSHSRRAAPPPATRFGALLFAGALFFAATTDRSLATSPTSRGGCSPRRCAKLVDRRDQAVLRGMAWMAGALENPVSLAALGTDAALIFLGAQTAQNPAIRGLALPLARYEAGRLLPRLLESPLSSRFDLFEALWLLPEAANLKIPAEPLLSRVALRLERLPTAEGLYGIDVARLENAAEDDLYELLINSYILDKARVVYPELPLPPFRLADALRFVFSRRFVTYDEDPSEEHYRFQDHAYLATHVAFVLSDFSRLKLATGDLGPLYAYLRGQFEPAMRLGDPELIAEFVDVFRTLGFDESNDRMVCRGTRFLLGKQNADGSWGNSQDEDRYDAIHPTWVIVDALRARTFTEGTPYAKFIESIRPLAPAGAEPRPGEKQIRNDRP